MGINWWEGDPKLSVPASNLERENQALRQRLDRLEAKGRPARQKSKRGQRSGRHAALLPCREVGGA